MLICGVSILLLTPLLSEVKNSFQIATPKKTIMVQAKTPEEKQQWMQAINACIQQQVEKSKSFTSPLHKQELDEAG